MIGIDFISFLILLVIAIIVAVIMHYVFKFYVISGFSSFLSKIVIAWIGAWLGSPVFGYWFKGVAYKEVYIIPAILGSFALILLIVDGSKSFMSKQQ